VASTRFDADTSNVFLLTYEPRKYRMLAGKRWNTELGFRREAHKPYTSLFDRAVAQTPKDPKGGIIATMRAVDEYLWKQTGQTDVPVPEEKPAAHPQRTIGNPANAGSRYAPAALIVCTLLALCVIAGVLMAIIKRRRDKLNLLTGMWRGVVSHAHDKLARHVMENAEFRKRYSDALAKLRGNEGPRTQQLYAEAADDLDAVHIRLKAMAWRLKFLDEKAESATVFNLVPIQEAFDQLEQAFLISTAKIGSDGLLGLPPEDVLVEPTKIRDLVSANRWHAETKCHALIEAAKVYGLSGDQLFPRVKFDALRLLCRENGIPLRWMADHPLGQDPEGVRDVQTGFYLECHLDPVAFVRKLEGLNKTESRIESNLNRLVRAIKLSLSTRLASPPSRHDALVDEGDDPVVTFESARRDEGKFTELLASTDSVEVIEARASVVRDLYAKAAEQERALARAESDVFSALAAARAKLDELDEQRAEAERRRTQAALWHREVNADGYIDEGDRLRLDGERSLADAERMRAEKRHLVAKRTIERATACLGLSGTEYGKVSVRCDELKRQRSEFEAALAKAEETRKGHAQRIRDYGGSVESLDRFLAPIYSPDAPQDYAQLMTGLTSQFAAWKRAEEQARKEYEEEQARKREEEHRQAEKARREREEELHRLHRATPPLGGHFGSHDHGSSYSPPSDTSTDSSGGSSDSSGGSW
jgi:hypothetical protein